MRLKSAAILLKQHDEKALEKNVTYTKEDLVTWRIQPFELRTRSVELSVFDPFPVGRLDKDTEG
ncbi:hypothetical protein P6709_19910, partial [Jeotgalibacillus sp. ET6]|nr:hypothetical protein [Jeotgalibacillus sp. ET6]